MKRWLPDTIFGRLFLLLLLTILLNHAVVTFTLFSGFFDAFLPRAPARRDGPPPFLWFFISMECTAFAVAAWFGARLLARPIQQLARAASQLGENLNYPVLLETGSVEARQAVRTFNQMKERLHAQMAERTRFLAAVSHDLRTPLTRIKLRIEHLDEKVAKDKLYADIAEMSAMLDATLEYLRGGTLSETWHALDEQAPVESMAEDAREAGRDVSVSGTARPLLTQPFALRRCITNVMENALRYGRLARISMDDRKDALLIDIHDAGPGIPEEQLELVFEPFVRLESSRNKASGGVGLGLCIAREAAQQCRGSLHLSNAGTRGLIAHIRLPRHS